LNNFATKIITTIILINLFLSIIKSIRLNLDLNFNEPFINYSKTIINFENSIDIVDFDLKIDYFRHTLDFNFKICSDLTIDIAFDANNYFENP
jgi:hypothetical protein